MAVRLAVPPVSVWSVTSFRTLAASAPIVTRGVLTETVPLEPLLESRNDVVPEVSLSQNWSARVRSPFWIV